MRIGLPLIAASAIVLVLPVALPAQLTVAPEQSFGTPALTAAGSRSTAICSPGDQPETGMQGETPLKDVESGRNKSPYYCGVRIAGQLDPFNRGNNGLLKRSRQCAYLSGAGIAVIDVTDPTAPKAVGLLKEPGAIAAGETFDVIDAGDRHLLVAGEYSNGVDADTAPFDIYDITDCTKPRHLAQYKWPGNLHIVKLAPDGKRVYATRPYGTAGVMVLDIGDISAPKFLGNFPLVLPGGRQVRCHDIEFNDAETRMYCAGSIPTPENRKDLSGPTIWDVSKISSGQMAKERRNPSWLAIAFVGESEVKGQGDHHAPRAVINGKLYMVAANELRPNAFPRLFDVSDEKHLRPVSEFRLESNDRALADPAWAKANAAGGYGLHYNSVVDNAWGKVALGMFSFMGSGVRIVDLRDPLKPREIAYYHFGAPAPRPQRGGGPGDAAPPVGGGASDTCVTQEFFIHETGQIWFSCQSGGFYVAELSPAVKAYLGVR